MDFFKKDTYYLGVLVGFVLPVALYGLLYLVDMTFNTIFGKHLVSRPDLLYILSIIANIISLRYFFTRLKMDKAGSGILLITIVFVLVYFFNFYQAV
mgnify:CR=1 FL=1